MPRPAHAYAPEVLVWAKTNLTEHEWENAPLWLCACRDHDHIEPEGGQNDWAWAHGIWIKLLELIESGAPFLSTLYLVQQSSLKILYFWWHGKYDRFELSRAVRAYVQARAQSVVITEPSRLYCGVDASIYHQWCFALWGEEVLAHSAWMSDLVTSECTPSSGRNAWMVHSKFLETIRNLCRPLASNQRIAYSVLLHTQHVKWNTVSQAADASALSQDFAVTGETCGWVEGKDLTDMLPRFIWDIAEKRTIDTKLESTDMATIKYTCISHTWGRFRIKGARVHINSCPWLVPCNTQFDVKRLPSIFFDNWQAGKIPTRYVWFDLLCIPQVEDRGCEVEFAAMGDIEIDRQAGIFRSAVEAVAWIHDDGFTSWDATMSAIRWAAVDWLRTRTVGDLYELETLQTKLEKEARRPIELCSEALHGQTWFSSLWTLQEACLKPSMILMNLTWDPLTDDEGNLIRLDSLLFLDETRSPLSWSDVLATDHVTERLDRAFFEANLAHLYGKAMPRPLGTQQLRDLHAGEYGNGLILSPSPSGILALSNRRYCNSVEDRWRAIQSVLGVQGWRTRSCPGNRQDEFVLGMYPLAFVRFVANQIGAGFYGADTISTRSDFDPRTESLPAGSMLCFRPHRSQSNLMCLPTWLVGGGREARDHHSVAHWVVQSDGSVDIPQAGILASHEGRCHFGPESHAQPTFVRWDDMCSSTQAYPCVMKVANNRGTTDIHEFSDVLEYFQACPPVLTFLVATTSIFPFIDLDAERVASAHHGTVLQGLDEQNLQKIGTYMISDAVEVNVLPPTSNVHWHVK